MIQNLIFEVYLFLSDFLARNLKAEKKQAKKITNFTIQFHSKNLINFTNLNLQHCKKYTHETYPKTILTLQMFQQTWF